MTDPREHSPRRYFFDNVGRRVLIGLILDAGRTLAGDLQQARQSLEKVAGRNLRRPLREFSIS